MGRPNTPVDSHQEVLILCCKVHGVKIRRFISDEWLLLFRIYPITYVSKHFVLVSFEDDSFA